MIEEKEWIGFDLDGTLAYYDKFRGLDHIGKPIKPIVNLFLQCIKEKKRVKIFTARANTVEGRKPIRKWLRDNDLPVVEITDRKDQFMVLLYDDRCIQVERNTGRLLRSGI